MGVHHTDHAALAANGALAGNDRILEPGLVLKRLELHLIVGEVNWIEAVHLCIVFLKAAFVHGDFKSFPRCETGMITAFCADAVVFLELIHENHILTARAFKQQVGRNADLALFTLLCLFAYTGFYYFK